jgi:hypothetical protein
MTPTNRDLIRQLELQDALLQRQAEKSLRSYVEQAWPILEPDARFLSNWHIDYLTEYLEAVTAGEITRLVINMPPRYMKSLLVSVFWPTWEWIQQPGGRWVFASYADVLSIKHSVDRRTVIQSPWYQHRWGQQVQLAPDQNVKSDSGREEHCLQPLLLVEIGMDPELRRAREHLLRVGQNSLDVEILQRVGVLVDARQRQFFARGPPHRTRRRAGGSRGSS